MMTNPNISVIIPVYNTEKYLKDCLDSVTNQSLKNIEIICINDGSTDNSSSILKSYAEKDDRIHVIKQNNQGLSAARNAGIKNACGEYICFLDSDDMLADNALEELYNKAKQDRLEILCFDIKCIYETEHLKMTNNVDALYKRNICFDGIKPGKELFTEMIDKNSFIVLAFSMLINREWLIKSKIKFYNGIIYEDNLFTFQCFMTADRMSHINKECIIYRIREHSIMTSGYRFSNLYSRLIGYIEIVQMAYKLKLDHKTQAAVYRFVSFIVEDLKHIYNVLDKTERIKILSLTPLEKLYLEGLGIDYSEIPSLNDNIYKEAFKGLCRNNKNIILYGAGHVGIQVLTFMKKNGLDKNIMCFAVTDRTNATEKIQGLAVYCIDDLKDWAQDGFILITARKNYQEDMYRKVRELGFQKIAAIDHNLERIISICN